MEVPNGENNKLFVCLYELLGTAFLLMAINLSQGSNFAISATIFTLIVMFGPVCGGHFNPAVTVAVFIKESKLSNISYALTIVFSQLVGACLGCLIVFGSQSINLANQPTPGIAILCPTPGLSELDSCKPATTLAGFNVFLMEMVCTGLFVSLIMQVKYQDAGSGNLVLSAAAVSGGLFAMISMIGGATGAAINPMVGLVQPVFQKLLYNGKPAGLLDLDLGFMWIYVVACLLGGVFAGLFAKMNEKALERGKAYVSDDREFKQPLHSQ